MFIIMDFQRAMKGERKGIPTFWTLSSNIETEFVKNFYCPESWTPLLYFLIRCICFIPGYQL